MERTQDADRGFELASELLHRAHGEHTLAPDTPTAAAAEGVALAAAVPLLASPPPVASREPLRWANYLERAANLLLGAERLAEAELATRLALAAMETRTSGERRDRQRETTLAAVHATRMEVLVALDRPAEAIAAAGHAIALRRSWLDEAESRPTHAINLFWLLTEAMDLALATGELDGARGLIGEAELLASAEGWSGGHGQVALGLLAERRGDLHAALSARAASPAERQRERAAAQAAYDEALRLYAATVSAGADDLDVAESIPQLRAKRAAVAAPATRR
jgi:hypothetical protein